MNESTFKSSTFGFPIGVTKIPVSLSTLTEVDANGLPRLPISVTCYARFRRLSCIKHSNLCRYLDAIREKGEIISVISEYYHTNFGDITCPVTDLNWLSNRFYECLSALAFMHDNGLVHACLTPDMIMLDFDGHVKIGGYGVFYATEWYNSIDFILPNPVYSAPEVFLFVYNRNAAYSSQFENPMKSDKCWLRIEADVWSLGVIFSELIYGKEIGNPLHKIQNESKGKQSETIELLLLKGLCQADQYPTLPEFLQIPLDDVSVPLNLAPFARLIRECLRFDVLTRPNPKYLLKKMDELLLSHCLSCETNSEVSLKTYFQKTWNHFGRPGIMHHHHQSVCALNDDKNNLLKVHNFMNSIKDLSELYYYWKLTGGKIHSSEKNQSNLKSIHNNNNINNNTNSHFDCYDKVSRIKENDLGMYNVDEFNYCSLPPILRIPHYLAIVKSNSSSSSRVISSEEQWPISEMRQPRTFHPSKILPLSNQRFIERISRTPLQNLYPLLICQDFKVNSAEDKMNICCSTIYSGNHHDIIMFDYSSKSSMDSQPTVNDNSAIFQNLNKNHTDFMNLLSTKKLTCNLGLNNYWCASLTRDDYEAKINSISQQPLSVREADVDYQIYRTRLFIRILNGLPATKRYLRLEARKDIPPFLRWKVWAALLGVYPNREFESSYLKTLHEINKLGLELSFTDELNSNNNNNNSNNNEQNVDSNKANTVIYGRLDEKVINQISVDLPRCHAYDPLLASPIGQSVLRRVLLATLLMKPGALDYTQGMDSVAAVFVRICYPDEALAAACLNAFLSTKLPGFFSSGGLTLGLKSYFNTLLRLLAFHLPRLAVHLVNINVPLIGLTTGWIYTLFAHAMPLDRVELLWDTIMPGPALLSMFFYIAFFVQLDRQINFESLGLEKICTILSNFPDINLDKCRTDALKLALATPRSLTTWSIPNKKYLEQKSVSAEELLMTGQSNSVEKEFYNSKENEPAACDFYTRLSLPNAWPDHLEYDYSAVSEEIDANTLQSMYDKYNISSNASKLVPLLSVKDALEHIHRPDCLVLDLRNAKEYNKFHLPNSIHCDLSKLIISDSAFATTTTTADRNDALPCCVNSSNLSLENWEMIDYPSGNRSRPQIIPEFLAFLMNEKLWRQTTQARQQHLTTSSSRKSSQGTLSDSVNSSLPCSPGLLIVFGNDEQLSWHLAYWLIEHDIDRVCILFSAVDGVANFLNSCCRQ
ncbi:unnamed protein product [Trichobilharzia szidati]|nr:unnamed protein product [Trichobilharzia szidati]